MESVKTLVFPRFGRLRLFRQKAAVGGRLRSLRLRPLLPLGAGDGRGAGEGGPDLISEWKNTLGYFLKTFLKGFLKTLFGGKHSKNTKEIQ